MFILPTSISLANANKTMSNKRTSIVNVVITFSYWVMFKVLISCSLSNKKMFLDIDLLSSERELRESKAEDRY